MSTDTIYRFLDSLAIGRKSRYSYVGDLRAFETFVRNHTVADGAVTLDTVRAWLKRDAARSPLSNVVHRAGVIARYLDWGAADGGDPNPFAALRRQYGRRLHPIVCALLETDYEGALLRLSPLPDCGSTFGPLIREHVARMQSLGYRYEVKARDLRRFDRFLQRRPELAEEPLPALLAAWQQSCKGLRHQLRVQQIARTVTQALHRRDLTTPIASIDIGLQRRVVQEERKPYLFTEAEVARLFHAARTYPSRHAPLRPIMLETALTLAYCAGLRIGEIARLTLGDVGTDDGTIEIHDTKFFKSRRLPLAPSVIRVLQRYLAARQATGAPTKADAPLWWSPRLRHGYGYSEIDKLLTRVIRRAGLKPAPGRRGPHVHDLRHTFVAHRMLKWYRDGVDPQSRLPHLATYLGHKDILSTLVYLNITPELLQQASERYRRRGGHALRASGGQS
jgi:integrase/recombinase XerD